MKPKAPRKAPKLETAAVLAAWLAVITASVSPQLESTQVVPFAYATA